VTSQHHGKHPAERADDVEEHETFLFHLYNTRYNRSECADDGQEAGQEDCAATIFLIKFFRLVKVFLFKEEGILSIK